MQTEVSTPAAGGALTRPTLAFHGTGGSYFGVFLVNFLLMVVTLGIYRPWAITALRKYLYQNTSFGGSRFMYTGTGSEMFIGFLKAIGLLVAATISFVILQRIGAWMFGQTVGTILFFLVYYAAIFMLVPIILHGSLRYRLSRTQWRSINWAYVGPQSRLVQLFVRGMLLTLVTFGIYGPWFSVDLAKEIARGTRFGDVEFRYTGDGKEVFMLMLKGLLLTPLTLGLYFFWYLAEAHNYHIAHTEVVQNGQTKRLRSNASGMGMISLILVNALITGFTFGLGYAWAEVRRMKQFLAWIEFQDPMDLDAIQQAPEVPANAVADFFIDFGDLMI